MTPLLFHRILHPHFPRPSIHHLRLLSSLSHPLSSPLAVLYQETAPPLLNGVLKPKKPGGYSDSGADIAYALKNHHVHVITPTSTPDPTTDLDWVFPDTRKGIQQALEAGADTLWANTVLFDTHPLQHVIQTTQIKIVGQDPMIVQEIDDKWVANCLLRKQQLNVARSMLVGIEQQDLDTIPLDLLTEKMMDDHGFGFPCIIKPVRGRGSQGVEMINELHQLKTRVRSLLEETYQLNGTIYSKYGEKYIVEEFLQNEEITVTVMPPGEYKINGNVVEKDKHWSLPIVCRFNHERGIAPYSGVKAVISNSKVVDESKLQENDYMRVSKQCEKAAEIVEAKAPIRVDCRKGHMDGFKLFDLNMKPNMTGAGRPGRQNQDSLTTLAARAIGWSYSELLVNILAQAWKREQ